MKYLILSTLRPGINVTSTVIKAVADHYELVKKLKSSGKLEVHYPLLGRHGGASIYDVKSHEELQSLLVQTPCSISISTKFIPFWNMKVLRNSLEKLRAQYASNFP